MADTLRSRLIRLAFEQPQLREHLLPLVRTASYPTVVREIEQDYRRKALTLSEREELLRAVANAATEREARRIVDQHRRGRVSSLRSASPKREAIRDAEVAAKAVSAAIKGEHTPYNSGYQHVKAVAVQYKEREGFAAAEQALTRLGYEPIRESPKLMRFAHPEHGVIGVLSKRDSSSWATKITIFEIAPRK